VINTSAYYILLLYTVALCKPILPLIQDELAHIFWNAEHVATVHYHHGHHHVEESIAEAVHEEENDKYPGNSRTSEPVSIHILNQYFYSFPQLFIEKEKYTTSRCTVSAFYSDKHYPPPKPC